MSPRRRLLFGMSPRGGLLFGGVFLAYELVVAVALVVGACGSGDSAKSTVEAAPPEKVHVHLDEWKVEPGVVAGGPGGTEFTIDAHNHGGVAHELLIVKTDLDPGSLPVAKARVDVAKAGELVGQVGSDKLLPNATVDVTLTLKPGTYVFICNIPGHYKQGMYASFRVE